MKIIPVVLCGGSGTRLWPLSRKLFPKQLLNLVDEKSLLQNTILRLGKASCDSSQLDLDHSVFISNEEHRFLVAGQLQDLSLGSPKVVLEPEGRNTAPALTAAAEIIASEQDALMLVLAADHLIQDTESFHRAICAAAELAEKDKLVTFGIVPDRAETGYGYIKKGSQDSSGNYAIGEFVEKPDAKTAERYVASQEYFWNSGMFMIKSSVWLKAINAFQSEIALHCRESVEKAARDLDFIRLDKESFLSSPEDSIDYAVMEKVTENASGEFQGAVVPLDAGWSDIGSWDSLWDVSDKDASGNVVKGDVICDDTSNSIVIAEHRLVTTVGLKDVVVVETADAIMVADKASSQNVKNIVNTIKTQKREEGNTHRCVYRPWGNYQSIDNGDRFQVKRIVVDPGSSLSLQMHHHRAEHWIVVRGTARVTKGEETFLLSENESTYIPIGVTHRLENPGAIPLELVEVQSGSYLGEDDIVRFEDHYGRNE